VLKAPTRVRLQHRVANPAGQVDDLGIASGAAPEIYAAAVFRREPEDRTRPSEPNPLQNVFDARQTRQMEDMQTRINRVKTAARTEMVVCGDLRDTGVEGGRCD